MPPTKLTSREFNRDTGGAKKAALAGPVFVTDRGRLSHVLLTFSDYLRLEANQSSIIELLGRPAGVEDIDFDAPAFRDPARPAPFD